MKHIFETVCVFCLLLTSWSCTSWLEVEPENTPTFYNFFESEADADAVMRGFLDKYRENVSFEKGRAFSGEIMDNCRLASIEGLRTLDATSVLQATYSWTGYYLVINQVLLLTENIDRIKLPQERYDFYMGEALFYRALAYFHVIRDWGDCPYVKELNVVKPEVRRPWLEVLDMAIMDMEKATQLLQPWKTLTDYKGAKITSKQIAGREAAYAVLAYMYAWKGSLTNDDKVVQKAIDATTFLIEKCPDIVLAPNSEAVCTNVMKGGDPESIFEIEVIFTEMFSLDIEINLEKYYQSYPLKTEAKMGDITKMKFQIMADRVLSMYKEYPKVGTDSVDLRRNAYFYQPKSMKDSVASEGWAYMQKRRVVVEDRISNPNNPEYWFQNFGGNAIVSRLADIILLRAECYAKLNKNDLAIIDLNRVRDRAKALSYNASEGSIYRMIFEEREKELLCERHRWYDMVRTGFWKTDMSEAYSKLTDQDVVDGALYLPVHKNAFKLNPLMRQNRYWERRK